MEKMRCSLCIMLKIVLQTKIELKQVLWYHNKG